MLRIVICLITIHQLQNPPSQRTVFLQLPPPILLLGHKKKNTALFTKLDNSQMMLMMTDAGNSLLFFDSGFSWFTPLPEICRGTTAEHLKK